jgi:UDP-N-acetyl-D-glucosamine dehydrogenase
LKNTVSVVGLGYVGLPLAVALCESGFKVQGLDLNTERVKQISNGKSPVEDIQDSQIAQLVESGLLRAGSDFSSISDSEIVFICVPTPIHADLSPDYSHVIESAKTIRNHLSNNALVVLESTVAPGFTRDVFIPLIRENLLPATKDLFFAFSPERIDPSNKVWTIKNTPKLIAGIDKESLEMAARVYSKFIDHIEKCDSLEVAETAKLLENSFRLINISFINEVSIFCQKIGIDVADVVNAANTKPYGFMPFYPSIGVGGHCIPVDPLYMSSKASEIGVRTSMIDLAIQINQEIPEYFVGRALEILVSLSGKRILVVGVAYKPNISDVRQTPVGALILGLKQKGAHVFWHDDLVKEWNGEKSVALSNEYDLAIIATPHTYLDLTKLGDMPILNTRGSI